MELILVRHGESTGNAEARMQGRRDFPLSERGLLQAGVLAEWLRAQAVSWDVAYCSPLSRAEQTAVHLCEALGQAAPIREPELIEIGAGELEGLDADELRAQYPAFFDRKVTEIGDFSAFGGESYDDVQHRVAQFVTKLTESHDPDSRILLVGHGGLNFQLLKHLICEPVPRVCIVRMGNCGVTLVRMQDRRGAYMGEIVWHVPLELMGSQSGEGIGAVFR